MSIISLQENLKNQDEADQLDGFIQPIFRIERCSNVDDISSAYGFGIACNGMEEGSSQDAIWKNFESKTTILQASLAD